MGKTKRKTYKKRKTYNKRGDKKRGGAAAQKRAAEEAPAEEEASGPLVNARTPLNRVFDNDTGVIKEITNSLTLNNMVGKPVPHQLKVRDAKLKEVTGIKPKEAQRGKIIDQHLKVFNDNALINITKIDLDGCIYITDKGVQIIADSCPKLNTIYLYDTQVTDQGLQVLADSKCSDKLTILRVGGEIIGSNITDHGVTELSKKCPNLKYIGLRHTSIHEGALMALGENCRNLALIDITNTLTSDAGIRALAQRLGKKLRIIALDSTLITDAGVIDLAALCTNLTAIDLTFTTVTHHGLQALFNSECSDKLTKINLGMTAISDANLESIANNCTNLKSIKLRVTQVTDTGIRKLIPNEQRPGCPNLTAIDLNRTNITDNGALELIRGLPNLIEIHMPRSPPPLETATALQQIQSQRPDLRFF